MKNYIGCKIIKAKPMTYGEYRSRKQSKFELVLEAQPGDNKPGYLVFYPNLDRSIYESWSPKNVFEMAYREIVDYEINLINDDIRL
jgi:hypothetical protein